jgi:Arc/MetJ-type ribon-helix-helix transcriptional regulator
MPISVRLDAETERALLRLVRKLGGTRSQVVRQAIRELERSLGNTAAGPTVYDRLSDVIGIVNLGPGTRAARSEEILREVFSTKRNLR